MERSVRRGSDPGVGYALSGSNRSDDPFVFIARRSGTDSGFEGATTIYFVSGEIVATPVP